MITTKSFFGKIQTIQRRFHQQNNNNNAFCDDLKSLVKWENGKLWKLWKFWVRVWMKEWEERFFKNNFRILINYKIFYE